MFKARKGSTNFEKAGEDHVLVPLGSIKILKSVDKKLYDKDVYDKLLLEQREYVFSRVGLAIRRGIKDKKFLISELYKYNKDYFPFWTKALRIALSVNLRKIFSFK